MDSNRGRGLNPEWAPHMGKDGRFEQLDQLVYL
jgi:hypothetical protein